MGDRERLEKWLTAVEQDAADLKTTLRMLDRLHNGDAQPVVNLTPTKAAAPPKKLAKPAPLGITIQREVPPDDLPTIEVEVPGYTTKSGAKIAGYKVKRKARSVAAKGKGPEGQSLTTIYTNKVMALFRSGGIANMYIADVRAALDVHEKNSPDYRSITNVMYVLKRDGILDYDAGLYSLKKRSRGAEAA